MRKKLPVHTNQQVIGNVGTSVLSSVMKKIGVVTTLFLLLSLSACEKKENTTGSNERVPQEYGIEDLKDDLKEISMYTDEPEKYSVTADYNVNYTIKGNDMLNYDYNATTSLSGTTISKGNSNERMELTSLSNGLEVLSTGDQGTPESFQITPDGLPEYKISENELQYFVVYDDEVIDSKDNPIINTILTYLSDDYLTLSSNLKKYLDSDFDLIVSAEEDSSNKTVYYTTQKRNATQNYAFSKIINTKNSDYKYDISITFQKKTKLINKIEHTYTEKVIEETGVEKLYSETYHYTTQKAQ